MNEQKPKKSKISYILPYLLTTVLIVLIVWLIVGQFSNPVETWSESDIDTYVGYNVNTKQTTVEDSQYYVSHVSFTNKNNSVVVVNGRRYNKEKPKTDRRDFTVVIQYDHWNEEFAYDANAAVDGKFPIHASYYSIFKTATDLWSASGNDKTYNDMAYIVAVDPYAVSFWDTW